MSKDQDSKKEERLTRRSYRKQNKKGWRSRFLKSMTEDDDREKVDDRSLEERVEEQKSRLNNNLQTPYLKAFDEEETIQFRRPRVSESQEELDQYDELTDVSQDQQMDDEDNKSHRFVWHHKDDTAQAEPAPVVVEEQAELQAAEKSDTAPDETINESEPAAKQAERKPIDTFLNYGIGICVLGIIIVSGIALFV